MYVMPSTPSYVLGRRRRRLSGLGIILARTGDGFDFNALPISNRRRRPPLPVAPRTQPQPVVPVASPTTTTTQSPSGAPQTGYCVVQSSPETGGVTSIVPCANVGPNRGGTVAPLNPFAAQPSQTSVPSNYPTNQAYFAVDGSVWSFSSSSGQWMETEPPGSSENPARGYVSTLASPVPAGYPTTQPYFSTDGSVWNYNPTIAQWVETQLPGSAAAALLNQQTGTVPAAGSAAPVTVQTGGSSYQSVIDWFSEDTIIGGIKNIWILGAGFLAYTFLKNKGRR